MEDQRKLVDGAGVDPALYGCLFCHSGKEQRVIQELKILHPEIEAISPSKLRYRRQGGRATEEQVALFPGYIFFRTDRDQWTSKDFTRLEDVLRLLNYQDGNWQLFGSDRQIAAAFFDAKGVVGFSKAYYEGDRIRITDGFLKQYEGSITRVNHRARTAEIRVDLQGKIFSIWLGFELIEPNSGNSEAVSQQ